MLHTSQNTKFNINNYTCLKHALGAGFSSIPLGLSSEPAIYKKEPLKMSEIIRLWNKAHKFNNEG